MTAALHKLFSAMVGRSKSDASNAKAHEGRLANNPHVERTYTADRDAMLAALRVVLGLPKAPPELMKELS